MSEASERGLETVAGKARAERWTNPLTVAVIAAALAGFFNLWLAYENNRAEAALEAHRTESDRILEVLKIGEPTRVRENLLFLIELGLVRDEELKRRIEGWQANPNRARAYLNGARAAGASSIPAPPEREGDAGQADESGRSTY